MEEAIAWQDDLKKMTALTTTEKPKNILYSEVEEAISTLKRNKSTGSDVQSQQK